MNMMDNLKDALALYLIRIEDKCKEWGMSGMDSTSLLVRDRNNSDMSIWLVKFILYMADHFTNAESAVSLHCC